MQEIQKKIPAGYTSGGTITVKTLKEQTPGDAAAAQILNNKKAWVEGTQLTGSMPDKSGLTVTASEATNDGNKITLTIPSNGYYSTNSKIQMLNSSIDGQIDTSNLPIFEITASTGMYGNTWSNVFFPAFPLLYELGYRYYRITVVGPRNYDSGVQAYTGEQIGYQTDNTKTYNGQATWSIKISTTNNI